MLRPLANASRLPPALARRPVQAGVASAYCTDAAEEATRAAFAYCAGQVRTYDYENYVWTVQLPKALRAAVIALRAFNVETALVGEHAKELPLAEIRMQWWREAVDSIYSSKPLAHPVIQALSQVVGHIPATKYRLQRLVSARYADLADTQPPATVAMLEQVAEGTASQLLYLQGDAAGVKTADFDHTASHLGKSVGIATLLRGSVHHAQRRRTYFPVELLAKEGVSQEDVYRGVRSDALSNIVFEVASVAKGHLNEARRLQPKLPGEAPPLLLASVGADLYMQALEKANFDIFAPKLLQGPGFTPLWHQLLVKYHLLRGTF